MFTGLIKETGRIKSVSRRESGIELSFSADDVCAGLAVGDSVAVDGVCLTVEKKSPRGFSAYASTETIRTTTLKHLAKGDKVNLEPSLRAGDPLGGHFVQGHAEGTGKVVSLEVKHEEAILKIELPETLMEAVSEKGSIAISGVSLTVSKIKRNIVEIVIVPHTLRSTTLKDLRVSSLVNVETDMIARQVVSYLKKNNKLTLDKLIKEGF